MSSKDAEVETNFLDKESTSDDSSLARETWGSTRTFVLALLGYSVGLGNVWRFPYLCYAHGGGAFLIPYFLFVIIAGIPMFFLEISLGQMTHFSAINVWKIAPCMKGIGYGCVLVNLFCGIYYITVLAWSFLYMFYSILPGDLPWNSCENWWNSENCTTLLTKVQMLRNQSTPAGDLVSNVTALIPTDLLTNKQASLPAQEFWKNYIVRKSEGLHDFGTMENWPMFLAFLVSWICIYFCVFKSVKSSGKIVYFSATAPYIMLFVLLIRGITLEGASTGISYLFTPNFTKLQLAQTWVNAGSQIFYTFGICFTVLFSFGSYNPRNNDCYKQAISLVFTGSMTSLFASIVIFSILGHLSHVLHIDMDKVADKGPGLAFFVYPVGLSLLPAPKVWSFLFFATLVLVGVDTQFSGVEATISVLVDMFPKLIQKIRFGRELLSLFVCGILFLLGIPFFFNGGIYLFELYNNYAASGITLLWLAMFESIAIGWVYGVDRFYDDIESMLGYRPHSYFKYCYRYFIPGITFVIFIFYCSYSSPLTIDSYVYPSYANGIGWAMSLVSMVCVPLGFLYHLYMNNWSWSSVFADHDLSVDSKLMVTLGEKTSDADVEMQMISDDNNF